MTSPAAQKAFRNVLGRFATGVTIVTARAPDGELLGLTVNSFSSVSLDPPLVQWSLSRKTQSVLEGFQGASHFAVHVLTRDQMALSNQFAFSTEKFAGLAPAVGLGGAPLLPDCLARFQCRQTACHDGGDHVIFLGAVEEYETGRGEPLLYYGGKYGVFQPHPEG